MNALQGVVKEVASVLGHLVRYPAGLGQDWQAGVESLEPPLSRSGDIAPPVLFIPGLADNKSIFTVLRQELAKNGCETASFGYRLLADDVRAIAAQLAERVEQLCAETGATRVHLVGHSMGGLVAQYYVQRLGGSARVDTVVSLATPHGGTLAARLLPPLRLMRQLCPNSRLLAELAEPATGCATRFLVFSAELDELIMPPRLGRLEHPDLDVRNIVVAGSGHVGLPSDPWVVGQTCAALRARRAEARGQRRPA